MPDTTMTAFAAHHEQMSASSRYAATVMFATRRTAPIERRSVCARGQESRKLFAASNDRDDRELFIGVPCRV